MHRALAAVQDAGRFGDRKVFIASLWTQMLGIEAQTGGIILTDGATIEHLKAWFLRARLLTRDGTEDGARLVLLCRADLVAAMLRSGASLKDLADVLRHRSLDTTLIATCSVSRSCACAASSVRTVLRLMPRARAIHISNRSVF